MHGDSVAEAEAFLGRWRRARHLTYREGLVNQPSAQLQQWMEQAGCAPQMVNNVVPQLRASERREMNTCLETKILASIYSLVK